MKIWDLRKCRCGLGQQQFGALWQLVAGLCHSRPAGYLNEVFGFGDVLITKDHKRNLYVLKSHVLMEDCVLNQIFNF